MRQSLISEIDEYLAERGISDHRFGLLAAGNGRLLERLRKGGRIWPETEAKVRAFLITESRSRARTRASARTSEASAA